MSVCVYRTFIHTSQHKITHHFTGLGRAILPVCLCIWQQLFKEMTFELDI